MAKKVETEAAPVQEKEVKKRPNYQRKMPIQYGPKRGPSGHKHTFRA